MSDQDIHEPCRIEQEKRVAYNGVASLDKCLAGDDEHCPIIRHYTWHQIYERLGVKVIMGLLDESDPHLARRHTSSDIFDDEGNREALADWLKDDDGPEPTPADLKDLFKIAHEVSEVLDPSYKIEFPPYQQHLEAVRQIAKHLLGEKASVILEPPHLISHKPIEWEEYYKAQLWVDHPNRPGTPLLVLEDKDAFGDDALIALTVGITQIAKATPNQ